MNTNRLTYVAQTVILNILSVFVISSTVWAATYYVDATKGNDANPGISESATWKTIAKINVSTFNPGDQILFKRGEIWSGTILNVPSDGKNGSHITLGAYGNGDKPILDGTGLSKTIYLNGRSFITISNLEIKKGDHGIFITSSATSGQINIINCEIHDSGDHNNISIKNRGNVIIEDCTIYNSGGSGISAYTSSLSDWSGRKGNNVKVLGNTIYNNSGTGFLVHGDNAVVRNNEFYRNGGSDSSGLKHNIYIVGDNAIVEKNILRDAVYGDGIRFEGSDLVVRYNLFQHNRKHDMGIWNDFPESHSNLTISYNLFIHRNYAETPVSLPMVINIDKASGAGSFSDVKIYNNSVYGENDNANGFAFQNCSNVTVRNNIINLKDALLIAILPTASVTSDYNILKSEESKPFSTSKYATFSQWQGDGYDGHSTENEPGFTDPNNNNLTLRSISPAVGAGVNLGQACDDGLHPNSNLPNSVSTLDQDNYGAWEIGAYVYQSGNPPAAPKNLRLQ